MRLSPLHTVHANKGVTFDEHLGWQTPSPANMSSSPTITITDQSWDCTIEIVGVQAGEVLTAAFGSAPENNGDVVFTESQVVIGRITPSRYLLIAELSSNALETVNQHVGDAFVSVTDQTEGQAGLYIGGDDSTTLLSKLCGLDLHPSVFPVNTVKISSIAKVRGTIWRLEDGWHVYFGRSYLRYVYETVVQAAAEFGV